MQTHSDTAAYMTHSPAPWRVATHPSTGSIRYIVANDHTGRIGGELAVLYSRTIADANLIAAAPDLLASLKELVEDYARLCGDGMTAANEPPELTRALAAIAKAESVR